MVPYERLRRLKGDGVSGTRHFLVRGYIGGNTDSLRIIQVESDSVGDIAKELRKLGPEFEGMIIISAQRICRLGFPEWFAFLPFVKRLLLGLIDKDSILK